MDILVIGSGLSGAIIANGFANEGKKVLVLEKRPNIGGNIYDLKENGVTKHVYGPHIFHTDNSRVAKYMEQFWELNNYRNEVNASVRGEIVPIPFNFTSLEVFWPNQFEEIKELLINKYGADKRVSVATLMSEKNPLLNKVANFIFDNVFLNYTVKMWDKKPSEIDASVMSRVPMLVTGYATTYFENKYEGIPKEGFTSAIAKMLDHKNIEVKLNVDATEVLKFKDQKIYLNNKEVKVPVVYSGPLDELFKYKHGVLKYRSLEIKFETLNQEKFQDTAVVNYPAHPEMTRITEYKTFLNEKSDVTILSREYPGDFDLKSDRFNIPYYPFANDESREQHDVYMQMAKEYTNLVPVGRLATYRYLNMDQAIEIALDKLKELQC